jgi:hypothetical protein
VAISTKDKEKNFLDSDVVIRLLNLLEEATLNELIRSALSEKKKIRDLFISVLKVLEVQEHSKVMVTLISFATNLCYGETNIKF